MGGEPVAVSVLNFARAETDRYFSALAAQAGVNGWFHHRAPADVEDQTVIRLNRDTLYSTCIADVSAGAVLTLPETGGRYQTAMIVDQDHFIEQVFDTPGEHRLEADAFPTAHVLIGVRTLVDPSDPDDLTAAAALQDGLRLEAGSATPFACPAWDAASLDATREALLALARGLPDTSADPGAPGLGNGGFGSRTQTEPVLHLLATAAGWGGLPSDQAVYLSLEPDLPVGHYRLRVGDVPVRAFWSVSVYGRDGYFEPNALGRYSVNSVTAERDPDGSVTVNLGGDPSLPNHIPLTEGWNYLVRLYLPDPEVLDGSWSFPACEPASE